MTSNIIHWRYYLLIEQDIDQLSRYIEISKNNYSTYSTQIAHSLLGASAEFEVVIKAICKILDPGAEQGNINHWYETLSAHDHELLSTKVDMPMHGISLSPLADWRARVSPVWWTSYNKVKHHRDTEYNKANLENLLNAVSSLLIMVAKLRYLEMTLGATGNISKSVAMAELRGSKELFRLPQEWYFGW